MFKNPIVLAAIFILLLLLMAISESIVSKKIALERKYVDNGYCQTVDHLGTYTWKKCECK